MADADGAWEQPRRKYVPPAKRQRPDQATPAAPAGTTNTPAAASTSFVSSASSNSSSSSRPAPKRHGSQHFSLHVAGLPDGVTQAQLRAAFPEATRINMAHAATKHFCFVDFATEEARTAAVRAGDALVGGRAVSVDFPRNEFKTVRRFAYYSGTFDPPHEVTPKIKT